MPERLHLETIVDKSQLEMDLAELSQEASQARFAKLAEFELALVGGGHGEVVFD